MNELAWRSAVVLITLSALAPDAACGQAQVTAEQVLAAWQAKRDRLPVVRYTLDGEYTWVKGELYDETKDRPDRFYPSEDVVLKTHRTMVLDYPRNRHRVESRDEEFHFGTRQREVREVQSVFDGTHRKVRRTPLAGESRDEVGLHVLKGDQRFGIFDIHGFAIHLAHGCVPWDDVFPGRLKTNPDPSLYRVQGETVLGGRRVVIVREGKRPGRVIDATEYWVDPGRDFAIVRRIERAGPRVRADMTIQYSQLDGEWLPDGWTATKYNEQVDRVQSVSRVRVSSRSLERTVTDGEFDLAHRPNELVTERTNEGTMPDSRKRSPATYYRADERGRLSEVMIENGVERPRRGWWPWIAGGAAAVVVARHVARRRRSTSPK